MAVTDIITLLLSFYFLTLGARRGFVKSLTVPFSIIVTTFLSIFYYQATQEIIISLAIALFGPVLLNLLLEFLLKKWTKSANRNIQPDFLSRLGGALVSLSWGWVFIVFTLMLIAVLPPWGKSLAIMRNDVDRSVSYAFAKPWGKMLFFSALPASAGNQSAASASGPMDAQSLSEDPRFKAMLQDPEIKKEVDAHDIGKLMANPRMLDFVQQIMSDPEAMKKVMAVYSMQISGQPATPARN